MIASESGHHTYDETLQKAIAVFLDEGRQDMPLPEFPGHRLFYVWQKREKSVK